MNLVPITRIVVMNLCTRPGTPVFWSCHRTVCHCVFVDIATLLAKVSKFAAFVPQYSEELTFAIQTGRSWFRFPIVSLDCFIDIILPVALWSWGRLSLLQNWVPGIFPGGKGGRCLRLTTLPPTYADYLKIWEPQPPETLRACQAL
jgi:hypothetical protein